jgi:hypothetical protein
MIQRSVADELNAAVGILTEAVVKLAQAEVAIGRAKDAANATGKPIDGLETLRSDLQTLVSFVVEQAISTIQKMAEDEAGSRG